MTGESAYAPGEVRYLHREFARNRRRLRPSSSLPALRLAPAHRPLFTCGRCGFSNPLIDICLWCAWTSAPASHAFHRALDRTARRSLSTPRLRANPAAPAAGTNSGTRATSMPVPTPSPPPESARSCTPLASRMRDVIDPERSASPASGSGRSLRRTARRRVLMTKTSARSLRRHPSSSRSLRAQYSACNIREGAPARVITPTDEDTDGEAVNAPERAGKGPALRIDIGAPDDASPLITVAAAAHGETTRSHTATPPAVSPPTPATPPARATAAGPSRAPSPTPLSPAETDVASFSSVRSEPAAKLGGWSRPYYHAIRPATAHAAARPFASPAPSSSTRPSTPGSTRAGGSSVRAPENPFPNASIYAASERRGPLYTGHPHGGAADGDATPFGAVRLAAGGGSVSGETEMRMALAMRRAAHDPTEPAEFRFREREHDAAGREMGAAGTGGRQRGIRGSVRRIKERVFGVARV